MNPCYRLPRTNGLANRPLQPLEYFSTNKYTNFRSSHPSTAREQLHYTTECHALKRCTQSTRSFHPCFARGQLHHTTERHALKRCTQSIRSSHPSKAREQLHYTTECHALKRCTQSIRSFHPCFARGQLHYGGGGGIRTHVGLHPNGFQDRLVMTTSIPLRISSAHAHTDKKNPRW